MANVGGIFDAPIPGQSLTQVPKATPMENPPQFVDEDQALEYVFNQICQPKQIVRIEAMLKSGIPIEYIARTILFQGVANGKWTPDLALLMAQEVSWMFEAIAKLKGIKAEFKNPDTDQEEFMAGFADLLHTNKQDELVEQHNEKFKSFFGGAS